MERENQMERERLGSRLGFILLSAGCAIGCGNVWKFPWMCGQYGGGGFVLIYILCLLLLGLPVMTMEFAIGRAAQASGCAWRTLASTESSRFCSMTGAACSNTPCQQRRQSRSSSCARIRLHT